MLLTPEYARVRFCQRLGRVADGGGEDLVLALSPAGDWALAKCTFTPNSVLLNFLDQPSAAHSVRDVCVQEKDVLRRAAKLECSRDM